MVWLVPYPTGGPSVPMLRNTVHAKPKASHSPRANFHFNLCRPCSCGDRPVDFCMLSNELLHVALSELPFGGPVREGGTRM
jgi:hypothetical protein